MSKQSKPSDRWRQLYASAHTRPDDWCKSCGYYPVANHGQHRDDCSTKTQPPERNP